MDDDECCLRLADLADELTLPVWRGGVTEVATKSDGSPVTTTDVEVETQLRAFLADSRPEDAFVGEEVGEHNGASGRVWVVDGIDGTAAFVMGRTEWSTLIGLVIGGQPVMGMVTSPALGRRWFASRTQPARLTHGRHRSELSVTSAESARSARVASWPPSEVVKSEFQSPARRLAELYGEQASVRPSWGSMVPNGAMLVAEGRLDAFVLFGGQAWDHAAPAAIVAAAGGRFSALDGTPPLEPWGAVYSNGTIHEELLDQLDVDHP